MSALGNAMHEQPGAVFFERARGVVNKAKNRDAALAYALGFLCHFALDSTCHPRVEQDVRGQRREPLQKLKRSLTTCSSAGMAKTAAFFDSQPHPPQYGAGESDRAVLSGHYHFAGL